MTVFQAQTPGGKDLQTLLATRTMQSVRCAVFSRITRGIKKTLKGFFYKDTHRKQ